MEIVARPFHSRRANCITSSSETKFQAEAQALRAEVGIVDRRGWAGRAGQASGVSGNGRGLGGVDDPIDLVAGTGDGADIEKSVAHHGAGPWRRLQAEVQVQFRDEGETWKAVQQPLSLGSRGMPGGCQCSTCSRNVGERPCPDPRADREGGSGERHVHARPLLTLHLGVPLVHVAA